MRRHDERQTLSQQNTPDQGRVLASLYQTYLTRSIQLEEQLAIKDIRIAELEARVAELESAAGAE